jgi:hypothetical protein
VIVCDASSEVNTWMNRISSLPYLHFKRSRLTTVIPASFRHHLRPMQKCISQSPRKVNLQVDSGVASSPSPRRRGAQAKGDVAAIAGHLLLFISWAPRSRPGLRPRVAGRVAQVPLPSYFEWRRFPLLPKASVVRDEERLNYRTWTEKWFHTGI